MYPFIMDGIIYTGTITKYNSKGRPLVRLGENTILIDGYPNAYKSPKDTNIKFILSDPRPPWNCYIGMIIDDIIPQNNVGTICSYSHKKEPLMECGGRIIFAKSFDNSLKVYDNVNYRIIQNLPNSDIAWVYNNPAVNSNNMENTALIINNTIEGIMRVIGKMNCIDNRIFSSILVNIQDKHASGKYTEAIKDITEMYSVMGARNVLNNYELKNPLRFLDVIIKEKERLKK